MKKVSKVKKKSVVKKPAKRAPVDETHILELMSQWQMPISVIAKNQNLTQSTVSALGKKFVTQKKLEKSVFERLNRDSN